MSNFIKIVILFVVLSLPLRMCGEYLQEQKREQNIIDKIEHTVFMAQNHLPVCLNNKILFTVSTEGIINYFCTQEAK